MVSPAAVIRPLVTVVDVSGQVTMTTGNYVGQSFGVPAGPSIDNLRFNWYAYASVADQAAHNEGTTAFGTLYILSQEYLGRPADLSASTPGFIAKSDSNDGQQYFFPPAVTLAGGAEYWVYADTSGAYVESFSVSSYVDGDNYVTGQGTSPLPFRKNAASSLLLPGGGFQVPPPGTYQDADFRLQGKVR